MIRALLLSSHPVPAAGVTLLTVLLGLVVGLEPWQVVLLGVAMALDQLSVGWSNDWIDADRDLAAGRADKPVARGDIPAPLVRAAAIVAAVASLAVTLPLGWPATLLHVVTLGSAWSYNAGLKRTALSVLPYLITFGLLPGLATLALRPPALPAWWAAAAGALLGLAAHIVNVLPDLDDDRRTGVRGFPHRLGQRAGTVVAGIALAGAGAALAIGLGATPSALAGLGASLVLSIAAVALGLRGSRWSFRLVIAAALLDVVLLLLAGGALAAG